MSSLCHSGAQGIFESLPVHHLVLLDGKDKEPTSELKWLRQRSWSKVVNLSGKATEVVKELKTEMLKLLAKIGLLKTGFTIEKLWCSP